jgi:hypothetical protein
MEAFGRNGLHLLGMIAQPETIRTEPLSTSTEIMASRSLVFTPVRTYKLEGLSLYKNKVGVEVSESTHLRYDQFIDHKSNPRQFNIESLS